MIEEFSKISGYSRYCISNLGRIVTKYRKTNFRVMRTHLDKDGYERVCLTNNSGKQNMFIVHRIVCALFNDGYKYGLEVNHKDSNRTNNCYLNLEWVSSQCNVEHSIKHGQREVKLNKYRATMIRHLYHTTNLRQIDIARKYGVSRSAVSRIVQNNIYEIR